MEKKRHLRTKSRHHFHHPIGGQASIPLFDNPWMHVSWGEHEIHLHHVDNFQPVNGVRHIRVLLYGPVGAGKSSFITSVSNALRRRVTCEALANAANSSGQSFSKKYLTHRIRKGGKGNYHCLVLNDTMGLEEGHGRGIHTHDIKLAMMGHVKEGYKFNPLAPLSNWDPGYNSSPSLNDRVHVMVCVHNANAPEIKSSILLKLRDIGDAAQKLGVPQLAVLTNIDEACDDTKINLRNVSRSKNLKKKISELHASLGIPESHILPVKNYSHEIQTCSDVDTLILRAVRRMIDLGHDFTDKELR
ncbi:interferon-induced protein 44-like isoform X1 [Xiphophorus hellerii]|uniref:interferon-induced protein 44-like isoform X1 n=1 Tax=Xiphophorus hellerii TaxID=8084 RepID=UPI0013B3D5DF|nr:interferon-induced protein 44-like isoform X1 [Xiphophorus hellerii]